MSTSYIYIPFTFAHERFANDVKSYVAETGLTYDEVGEMIGLDGSTVNNYANNRATTWFPMMKTFLSMCNLMSLDPRNYFELDNRGNSK